MIQFGAKINATEGNGRTPLILATQMTDLEMVEIFLMYKAVVVHIDLEYNNALPYGIPGETCYQLIRKATEKDRRNRIDRRASQNFTKVGMRLQSG